MKKLLLLLVITKNIVETNTFNPVLPAVSCYSQANVFVFAYFVFLFSFFLFYFTACHCRNVEWMQAALMCIVLWLFMSSYVGGVCLTALAHSRLLS